MVAYKTILGEDDFLRLRAFDKMLTATKVDVKDDFQYAQFSFQDGKVEDLEVILKTPSLLGGERVVALRRLDVATVAQLKLLESILSGLKDPELIVLVEGSKVDKRTTFFQFLKKQGELTEVPRLYANHIPGHVQVMAKELSLHLDEKAVATLVDLWGIDLAQIYSELQKISLFLHPEKNVTQDVVISVCGAGVFKNVFDLTQAIGRRDLFRSQSILQQALDHGESVVKLVALCRHHFRKLVILSEEMQKSKSKDELAKLLGVPLFFLDDYLKQVRQFSFHKLNQVYHHVNDLSFDLRQSRISSQSLFENFIQTVCCQ